MSLTAPTCHDPTNTTHGAIFFVLVVMVVLVVCVFVCVYKGICVWGKR